MIVPERERGRPLTWVAGDRGVGRESHQLRRYRSRPPSRVRRHTKPKSRRRSADAGGVPGAASPRQCLAPRAPTTKPERWLRRQHLVGLLAMTTTGFSPHSRTKSVNRLAMTVIRSGGRRLPAPSMRTATSPLYGRKLRPSCVCCEGAGHDRAGQGDESAPSRHRLGPREPLQGPIG